MRTAAAGLQHRLPGRQGQVARAQGRRAPRIAAMASQEPSGFPVPLDEKLQKVLLSTPFDFLAFGPRVALAAALSMTETQQTIQESVTKLQELAQDPRPVDVKAQEFSMEVQLRLADYAERGRVLEEDLVRNVEGLLPPEVQQLMPQPMDRAPPSSPAGAAGPTTTVQLGEEDDEAPFDYSTFSADSMRESRAAVELADLKTAVGQMRDSLSALTSNTDPMKEGLLKVNAREARDALPRRLQQLSPETLKAGSDAPVMVAVEEATKLVDDVTGLPL